MEQKMILIVKARLLQALTALAEALTDLVQPAGLANLQMEKLREISMAASVAALEIDNYLQPTEDTMTSCAKVLPINTPARTITSSREDVFELLNGVDDLLDNTLTITGQATDEDLGLLATAMQHAALLIADYLTVCGVNTRLLVGQ